MRQVPNTFFPYFIAIAIDAIGFVIISPILPSLIEHLNTHNEFYKHSLYSVVLSLYSFSYMMGAPMLGALSDRLGRRISLIVSAVGALIGFLLYALSFAHSSLSLLLIARIVSGFCSSSQCIAQAAMADLSHQQDKAKNIGFIAIAMTTGLVVGPLLSGFMTGSTGDGWHRFQWAFYLTILFAILNIVFLLSCLKESYHPAASAEKIHLSLQLKQFFNFFRMPIMRRWLFIFLLFEMSWSLYYQSLAIILFKSLHLNPQSIAVLLSFVGISLSFFLFFLVRLASSSSKFLKIVQLSFITSAVMLTISLWLNSLAWHYLLALIITAMVALGYTSLITELSQLSPPESQGLLMGTTDGLLALAFTITALLAGYLSYLFSILPFLVAALFLALAAVLFHYSLRKSHATLS